MQSPQHHPQHMALNPQMDELLLLFMLLLLLPPPAKDLVPRNALKSTERTQE